MEKYANAFRRAILRISKAASDTVQEYADKTTPDETNFTPALCTRIQVALDGFSAYGISWKVKYLSNQGGGTEEKKYGADFLGLLTLALPDYVVRKGFLAQAKIQDPGERLSSADWTRLTGQCESMLKLTTEGFVFVYSLKGVFVVPAVSVLACQSSVDLHTLHPKKIGPFFREHFECYVGDRRICRTTPDVFVSLLEIHATPTKAG